MKRRAPKAGADAREPEEARESAALSFRALGRPDYALLGRWLDQPHVAQWWPDLHDPGSLESRYGPSIDGQDLTELFIVESDGRPIGFIQRYDTEGDPEWRRMLRSAGIDEPAAGIDYLIGEESLIGRGRGPLIIDRFVEDTLERWASVASVSVIVQQANRRSWRALEKSGFERVWAGMVDSDDPSDAGPSFAYRRRRPVS